MELQFHKTLLPGLQLVKQEVKNLEETQELRLSDSMPDIGRVLGAWGQVLLRGKEWRSGSAHVTGGVQVWVLYVPEDGVGVQCMQTWIPFHVKWEIPDTQVDGMIHAHCLLRSADARNTSSRKMMVRINVGVMGQMWVPAESNLYHPEELPEDICLLRRSYPVRMPRETGEKAFAMEEELTLPPTAAKLEKLLHYSLQPELLDRKIMSDKVVFRGTALLHVVYIGEDGNLHTWDFELPFSQYAELEHEYEPGATAHILPAVTSLEMEKDLEGRLQLKAGMTGQYMICDQSVLEVVEDAYSPFRAVIPQMETMPLPVILDEQQQTLGTEQTVQAEGSTIDLTYLPDHPYRLPAGDGTMGIPGQFQLLYCGDDGQLQTATARGETQWQLPAEDSARMLTTAIPSGRPQTAYDGSGAVLRADTLADTVILSGQGLPMVTGLEIGEAADPDPERPSLILRRAGDSDLWTLAKQTGSTVERIQKANRLEGEPSPEQLLLISVI